MLDLRNGVMGVLIALLPRVGPRLAQSYHPTIFPMLDAATNVHRPESLSLLEDGLRLWHVALTQTAAYDAQGIGALFPRLVAVLDHGFEHTKAVMLLLEDYLVVGGAPFLGQHLSSLLQCLRLALGVGAGNPGGGGGGVTERGLGPVVRVMETFLVGFPEEASRALIDAGIHDRLLQQCLAPGNPSGAWKEATKVQFLSVLARSLLTAPAVFLPFLQRLNVEPLVLVDAMLELWDEVPSGSTHTGAGSSSSGSLSPSSAPARRKLWCMALLFLLSGAGETVEPPRRQVWAMGMLGRLEQVLSSFLDVLAEMEAEERERQEAAGSHVRGTGSGHLHGLEAEAYEAELLEDLQQEGSSYLPHGHATTTSYAPHPLVQALVAANDAVARADLTECLQGAMGGARALVGAAAFDAAARNVHPAVAEQMQRAAATGRTPSG